MPDAQNELLLLPQEFYMGHGRHKIVYIDPRDSRRCIKVPFHLPDSDLRKELRYRKALRRRGLKPSLLVKYYGEVETDKGTGFVFERVVDFDGVSSMELGAYFRHIRDGEAVGLPQPPAVLLRLRDLMETECIVVPKHCGYDNILIQKLSPHPDDFAMRIIDDLGSNAKVPFLFYFDFLARRHALNFWRLLLSRLEYDFPEVVSEAFVRIHHLDNF